MNQDNFLDRFQKVPVEVYQHRAHAEPLVSVCVQTYQHVNFIKDCLDGILMQKTNFPFEILLGEDASTDGTREICIDYAEKYPDKIRLFLHHRENNIKINGMPTGRFNLVYNIFSARGKYIALCEGDDYWTDPNKLQKQVHFLNRYIECATCFHAWQAIWESSNQKPIMNFLPNKKQMYTLENLLRSKDYFVKTCTVMLRRGLFDVFPNWFYEMTLGDYALDILNAHHGKLGYIDEVMATYRIHRNAFWSQQGPVEDLKATIKNREIVKNALHPKYAKLVEASQYELYYELCKAYVAIDDRTNAKKYSVKALIGYHYSKHRSLGGLFRLFLNMYTPSLYQLLKSVKEPVSDK